MQNTPFKDVGTEVIGHRLKELRQLHSKKIGKRYTQKELAELLDVKQAIISRLEMGMGTMEIFMRVLLLYQSLGYNILWVLYPDNSKQNITLDDFAENSLYENVSLDAILIEKSENMYELAALVEKANILAKKITNTK